MYSLKEDQVQSLVQRIVERFPNGQIMFDAISRLYLKMQKTNVGISAAGARMRWGVGGPYELEQWGEKTQKAIKNVIFFP